MELQYYRTSQFARKASVSIRTLRYYDKIGLLSPSNHSDTGFRLYTERDLEKLQFILALKYLAFSLEEIGRMVQAGTMPLRETFAQQKMMMLEKRDNLDKVIHAISEAEELLENDKFSYDLVEKVMKIMQADLKHAWIDKYFTSDQRNYMRDLVKSSCSMETLKKLVEREWTEEDQNKHNQRYSLFRLELNRLITEKIEPSSEDAQKVAKMLHDINMQYSKGEPEIIADMRRLWINNNSREDERKPSLYVFSQNEREYIHSIMRIFYRNIDKQTTNHFDSKLKEQYADSRNFMARVELNRRFSTNPYGWTSWVFDQMKFSEGARVLELGSGNALLWKSNLHRIPENIKIVLTDFSNGMLNDAKKVLGKDAGRFEFRVIDIGQIDYPDSSFDIVIANHMLYHVQDRRNAFSEITRVLKDRGNLYASTFGINSMKELTDLVHKYDDRIIYRYHLAAHAFGLETGKKQLEEFFEDVIMKRYEDSLEVTEARPLVDYALSSSGASNIHEIITGDRVQDFEAYINNVLERNNGILKITKDSGMFIANNRKN